MNRSYLIKPFHSSMRLDRWLRNNIGKFPQSLIEKSLRKGKIKINKKKTTSSYKLKAGDSVDFFNFVFKKNILIKKEKYIPSKKNLVENEQTIIENNENFIVINKKAGIASQGGTKSKKNIIDLFSNSKYFLNTKPYSVHRLDKDTSGVMIIAKNHNFARLLTTLFRLRKIHKTYLAICYGSFKNKKGELKDELIRYDNKKKIIEVARSTYRVVNDNGLFTLVELKPMTGRKHQLRKQLLIIGNPIVGDDKYFLKNKFDKNYKNLMLHAYKLKFFINNQKFFFKAELPSYFNEYLKKKRLII